MIVKRGSFLLPAFLTFLFAAFSFQVAHAAAPTVLSAKYIDADNVLEIVFDQPVYNDSIRIVRGGITLDGDNGGKNPDLTLTGGFISGTPELSATVRIALNYADQQVIETMVDRQSLELVLAENSFINENLEGNAPLGIDDDLAVEYIADPDPPAVVSTTYDASTNILTIEFSKPVNGRRVELTRIAIDDDMGGKKLDLKFSSINERVETKRVTSTIKIALNPKHQQVLESFDTANLILLLQPFTFIDEKRNSNVPTDTENIVPITYIADPNPTKLLSAEYDASANNLILKFNEKVITTFWDESAVNFKGITINDVANSVTATLSGAAAVSVKSDTQMVIMVLPSDQRLIENLQGKDNLVLTLKAFSILDEFGNGIREYTLDDGIAVNYVAEADKDAPALVEASYNAATNVLSLTFGNITARTRGIDTTNVDLSGVTLDDDNGGPNPDVVLSGGKVKGIKTGRPKFVRLIEITVTPEDEAKIESFSNKDQISIGLKPLSFFHESYTKTRNGNHELPVGEIMVSYAPDSTAPQLLAAKYDFKESTLKLTLDKLVKISAFNPTAVSFGGVRLTGGKIVEENAASTITISITSADSSTIEALPLETKAMPNISIDAGAMKNLDDFANEAFSYVDGDANPAGQLVSVGYGRSFWDKSYELFQTLDQLIPASLRGVGAHSYFYVADDQWNVNVTPEDVQKYLQAFESSTPADNGKGIYQICRETYGEEKDTDGDPRIIIFMTDLRDEFERASGDASADIPKSGAFEVRNELPLIEDPHSNQADMLYIDSYPTIKAGLVENALATYFTEMIMHNVDSDEEQWLVNGLASLAPDICGYPYSNFRFPPELPLFPVNSPLTQWTGWTGGHPGTDINERNKVYLFLRYIYEQYGGVSTIKAIAAEQENGIESVDKVLSETGQNVTVWSILKDLAVASLADVQNDPTYGNKYGFAETDLRSSTIVEIPFKSPNFTAEVSEWAVAYHLIKSKNNPGTIRFNGTNGAVYSLRIVTLSPLSVTDVALDDQNEAEFSLPTGDQSVYLVIAQKTAVTGGVSSYVISKDLSDPDYVNIRVFQNPSVNRIIDFHVVASERLYDDVPPTEGPKIVVKSKDTKKEFTGALAYFSDANENYNYNARVDIQKSGDYTFTISGQDAAGNAFSTYEVSASIKKLKGSEGGVLADAVTGALLEIPPHALKTDLLIAAIAPMDGQSVAFGTPTMPLQKKALLIMPLQDDLQASKAGIFRRDDEQWVYIGGKVDKKSGTIRVWVDKLGEFGLNKGDIQAIESAEAVPDKYDLAQNYPNPFNPTTTIHYDLPEAASVVLKVYDILGKEVATLVNDSQEAGAYDVQFDAAKLSTGVYFYTIRAGEFSMTRKMMVIK